MTDHIIQIGPAPYTFSEAELEGDDSNMIFGRMKVSEQTIKVHRDLTTRQKNVTCWHEMLHAMLYNAGTEPKHEEQIVTALANSIVDALERNPHMRSYAAFAVWRSTCDKTE